MALEHRLIQKLSQSLLMTPQLQQAIKLLQLGRLEYQEAIEKELLDNPILEEIKEEEDSSNGQKADADATPSGDEQVNREADSTLKNEDSPVDWENYLEHFTDYRGAATPKGTVDFEDRPSVEATLTEGEDLQDHLFSQIRMLDLEEADRSIAIQIVGNLDGNGYLCSSYEELAETCSCSNDDVERVIRQVRNLDPPGIAARDLRECLLVQLEDVGLECGLEGKIVRNHLDKLERRRYDHIAKDENVAVEDVYRAVLSIQSLEPRPGRGFNTDPTRYIVPDVYVYKVSGEYVVVLNDDGMPKLRVSPYYLKLLRQNGDEGAGAPSPDKAYLTERLKAASWLIKSIHQRQQTIYKVTESIVKFQLEFLESGIERLKPLVLRDVADDIGMHESTVSRVTTNKYVHTSQGVYELKYFFSTGIKTADGEISSSTIKVKIKNLIAVEPADKPYSDQKLVELLNEEEIIIARRTVAKYREMLGILSSSKRKRPF